MTTRTDDVASVSRGPRYAIYTCTPTAPELAHMVPLVKDHRGNCEDYFKAHAPPGAQLAGTTYDDEADLAGARPAFERLVTHVEEGRVHVVLLITASSFSDGPEKIERMITRLQRGGANVINIALVAVCDLDELLSGASLAPKDVS